MKQKIISNYNEFLRGDSEFLYQVSYLAYEYEKSIFYVFCTHPQVAENTAYIKCLSGRSSNQSHVKLQGYGISVTFQPYYSLLACV